METFLRALLPRVLDGRAAFRIVVFQGKSDLLARLPGLLRGYARWLPDSHRIVVLVDRDDDDCVALKQHLESVASEAGLVSRSAARSGPWRIVNRIAVEELEAWYFGDWDAVCQAYPRARSHRVEQAGFRDPDAIVGGTWEAFERQLKKSGYFRNGLRKIEAARAVAPHIDPKRNRSRSFVAFHDAIRDALGMPPLSGPARSAAPSPG